MQYKSNEKIIIDKRKLDTLIRLKCPEKILIKKIFYDEFTPTNDSLIDENLETLTDRKTFSNWGGSRDGAGRKHNKINNINQDDNHLENQDENQVENHLENQVDCKLEDIEKDYDYIGNNKIKGVKGEKEKKGTRFENSIYYSEDIPQEFLTTFEEMKKSDIKLNYIDPFETYQGFKDYWIGVAGQKGTKMDWVATWRNWIRNTKAKPKYQTEEEKADEFWKRITSEERVEIDDIIF